MIVSGWLLCLAAAAGGPFGGPQDDELVVSCRTALAELDKARGAAEDLRSALDAEAQRLAGILEAVQAELPAPPPPVAGYAQMDAAGIRAEFELRDAYLAALTARAQAVEEGGELVANQAQLIGRWPVTDERLAGQLVTARDALTELKNRVDLGELAPEAAVVVEGKTLEDLLGGLDTIDATRAEASRAIEVQGRGLEAARAPLAAAEPPDPDVLRRAKFEREAATIFVTAIEYEEDEAAKVLAEDPALVRAGLDRALREWRDGSSTYPSAHTRAEERRAALADLDRELSELAAPDKDVVDEGEGHGELRTARRELRFAEAVQTYRERRVALIEEARAAAEELHQADLDIAPALLHYAMQLLGLGAHIRAADDLVAQGLLEAEQVSTDREELWSTLRSLVVEEAGRKREIAALEIRLGADSSRRAAAQAVESQKVLVGLARLAFEEESTYAAVLEEVHLLEDADILAALEQEGSIETELQALQEELRGHLERVEQAEERLAQAAEDAELVDDPHTRSEINRYPQRLQEILKEIEGLAAEAGLPKDTELNETRSAALEASAESGQAEGLERAETPVPSSEQLRDLEREQVAARGRLRYFNELQVLVQEVQAADEDLAGTGAAYQDALARVVELERRRYAYALEIEERIAGHRLTRFRTHEDMARWVSRAAVNEAKGLRAEFRARLDHGRGTAARRLERWGVLLEWKPWAGLESETAQTKLNLIAQPVEHVGAATTAVEDLPEYLRENLDYEARRKMLEERPALLSFLSTFTDAQDNQHFHRTLQAYYLGLANNERVAKQYADAKSAYEDLIELNLEFEDKLEGAAESLHRALEVRREDYRRMRYLTAIAARPDDRNAIVQDYQDEYGTELLQPADTRGWDRPHWANRLLAAEARLWGTRHAAAELEHRLSRLGLESEVGRFRAHVANIESKLEELEATSANVRGRAHILIEERAQTLKKAALNTLLRISIIPILVLLVLRVLRRLTRKMRQKASPDDDDEFSDRQRRLQTLTNVAGTSITVMVWIVAGIYVLAALGLDITPIVASASVAGLALAFGAQSLVRDYFAGFFILFENQYAVGDVVDLGSAMGTVEHISLRVTVVRDLKGVVHYVPNGLVQRVSNKTKGWSRVVMEVGVAYGEDIDRVREVLGEVLVAMKGDAPWSYRILEEPQVMGVQNFAESSINVRLMVKTLPGWQWDVERELRARIKRRFDAEGIDIPLPQRVVHHIQSTRPAARKRGAAPDGGAEPTREIAPTPPPAPEPVQEP